jgi:pSer/pThr/pTyr-binding forkhead associated (FHA) protein
MAKLIFLLAGNLLGEYSFDKERITIGRRPSNDIHIDNLAVSGEHAVVLTLGTDSFLEDLNSTNGTLVNQKLIKKHVLQHNDLIELGKYQLKYISEVQTAKPANNGFADTVLITPTKKRAVVATPSISNTSTEVAKTEAVVIKVVPDNATPLAPQVESAKASQEAQNSARIKLLDGEDAGQDVLLDKIMVKLGKPGGQLALVTKRPHGYFITHIEGETHPIVNGESIGVQAHALNDHDIIEISGVKMEFFSG